MLVDNTRATGTITISINGTEFTADLDENGTALVHIESDLWAVGNYSFNVTYSGDGNFTAANATGYFLNITQDNVTISSEDVVIVILINP